MQSRWIVSGFLALMLSTSVFAELRVAASAWPPYVDEKAERKGVAVAIVEQALTRAGYELSMVVDIWPRSLEGTRSGVYDVIAAAWYSDERNKELAFSQPFMENHLKFVKLKSSDITFDTMDDLNGKMIGTVRDYAYGEPFESAALVIRAPTNHALQNLNRLAKGQIDLVLADEYEAVYNIKNFLPGQENDFEVLPKIISTNSLHIAISRAHPDYEKILRDFDAEIVKMKGDGSLQAILDDYRVWVLGTAAQ